MKLVKCPACGGPKLLPNGEICKECTRGMIVICEDCKTRAIEKGRVSSSSSEFGLSEKILYQCPKCKATGIIDIYYEDWFDL